MGDNLRELSAAVDHSRQRRSRGVGMFLVILVLVGCDKPKPVVVIDGWWNVDFAKNTCQTAKAWYRENAKLISQFGCDKVTSCVAMMPTAEACVLDPVQDVRTFEVALATEFAANAGCSSVRLVHFKNPDDKSVAALDALQGQHWLLGLDYRPGAGPQMWWLQHSDHTAYMEGTNDPIEIARKVCIIANQKGATVAN